MNKNTPTPAPFITPGRIVNVSSVAGLYGYPGLSAYCASKHAVEGASAVLREELRKFNVKVVTVQPGDFSRATRLLVSLGKKYLKKSSNQEPIM